MNRKKLLFAFTLLFTSLLTFSANAWPSRNKCCDPCDPCCGSGKNQEEKVYKPSVNTKMNSAKPKEEISVRTETTTSTESTTSSEPQELVVPQDQGIETSRTTTTSRQEQNTSTIEVETKNTETKNSTSYYPGLW